MENILPLGNDVSLTNNIQALTARINPSANVEAAAQEFEAMFATQLLKPMFDTVPVNGAFGGGNGEAVMRTFMLQEYGKLVAKTGVLGIAAQVKTEMIRAQEGARARKETNATRKAAENLYMSGPVNGESRVSSR